MSSDTGMPAPPRPLAFGAVCALATLLLALTELRHGIAFGPDAWTYWTASVSLLEGRGYVDAHGLTVQDWPPLYSLWLAAVQSVAGVSVASVRVADAIAAAAFAGFACGWVVLRLRLGAHAAWPVAVFTAGAALVALRGVSSEHVMHALLFAGLLALQVWRTTVPVSRRRTALLLAALAFAAATATRHAALAFVPAAAALILLASGRTRRQRWLAAGLVGAAAVGASAAIQLAFGQRASFPFGSSHRELLATATVMLRAVGEELAPFPLGIAIWLAMLAAVSVPALRRRAAQASGCEPACWRHGDVATFVGVAMVGVLLLFLLVHVADPPKGRFVRFAAVMVGGLAVGLTAGLRTRRWRWVLLLVLLLPNVLRAGKHVVVGRHGHDTVTEDGGESWLPLHATWRPGVAAGTQLSDGRMAVEAPLFRWQRERLQAARGR